MYIYSSSRICCCFFYDSINLSILCNGYTLSDTVRDTVRDTRCHSELFLYSFHIVYSSINLTLILQYPKLCILCGHSLSLQSRQSLDIVQHHHILHFPTPFHLHLIGMAVLFHILIYLILIMASTPL